MTTADALRTRSTSLCELCGSNHDLDVYEVPPISHQEACTVEKCAFLCAICRSQLALPQGSAELDEHHWRCLNASMWSEHQAVQVTAWRLLTRLRSHAWSRDLLDTFYLDDESQSWAEVLGDRADGSDDGGAIIHLDSNGAKLAAGDTVTLIKDLAVKGAGFTAKRGTVVRNITIDKENAQHIEGRVNGQQIVILTQYVKKS